MKPPNKSDPAPPHTLADHAFGADAAHAHAAGEDHDHEHDSDDNLLAAGAQDLARVELLSIGVDIGSSGSQIAFSRLLMYGPGEPLAMRRQVKARETLHLSSVVLTPYADAQIDLTRLRGTLARAFADAGLKPDDIDTGVIIMTGVAARRANAAAIVEALALETGDIVAAAAGDHLEAALAAHGSGAVERSRRDLSRILNIDIGGGTTKLARVENGRIVATAALEIGGRSFALDAQGCIVRLEPAAQRDAQRCGFLWRIGDRPPPEEIRAVAERCADDLIAVLSGENLTPEQRALFLTEPLPDAPCEGVMFSGGVAEYVYGRETRSFGDLGRALGRAVAARAAALPAPLLPPGECIRATVLGCSEYAVQLSGATSCITAPAKLLPRRNLPVLQPAFDFSGPIDADALAKAIAAHRHAFGDDDPQRETAYAFRWRGEADHPRIRAFAEGVRAALSDRIAAGANLYLMLEGDAALSLGAVLRDELGVASEILVLDGLVLRDLDYVDIGRLRLPSGMVPVTVKSLQFGKAAP